MPQIIDIFNDDAFSLASLTASINSIDHVPGRAGELVFAGVSEGVETDMVSVERVGDEIKLIQTSARGGPSEQEREPKRELVAFEISHIKLEETIYADQIRDIAARFGDPGQLPPSDLFGDRLRGAQNVVTGQMNKMARRHDLTLEHHRLGALKGVIHDADGSVLIDLYSELGFLNSDGQPEPETFDFALDDWSQSAFDKNIRAKCSDVIRFAKRNIKTAWPNTAKVWAFCGDNFFDKLLEHPSTKAAFLATEDSASRLGDGYVGGAFEFGGIVWENYTGTDDNTTVAIDPDEARLFVTGVPGLYIERFAPGDFLETVNKIGLPRYAKIATDKRFNQFVTLHTQQNPLPLCLRPQTLMRAI